MEQDQNTTPTTQSSGPIYSAPETHDEHRGSMGAVIGAIIIVVILLLIGLYLWGAQLAQSPSTVTDEPVGEEPATEAPLSGTDDVSDIENDLNNTELGDIDDELNSIDAELEAEIQ